MFSDIRGFTPLAESQSPEETIELLNTYYTLMFSAISGHGGIVSLMIGDGLMAIFGAPLPVPEHRESAVRAASSFAVSLSRILAQISGRAVAIFGSTN